MLENINKIVERLKSDTNNLSDIVYRKKKIRKKEIYIIYNEPLTSSDKISDFIIRSLNNIDDEIISFQSLFNKIENDISNFKVSKIKTYEELCSYLHKGFTIILVDGEKEGLVLETKADIKRGISTPERENSIRGSLDAFVEEYQTNIGLIKKRIKNNNLWIETLNVGKYTQTQIGVLSINGIVKKKLVNQVIDKLNSINTDGVLNNSMIKNLIEKENKSVFPTIMTSERPDIVAKALLDGKIVIISDNSPFALIIPALLNDFFKTPDDFYGKSINVTLTRIIKHLCFWIALLIPALYIAMITYNQEMIPTDLLVSFATQRDGVPFPAFFEAIIMLLSFEILREADMRVPNSSGSALSIVGALILGEAAVNAGIVSPIMIIVISITAISSLPFSEIELINGMRWYRLFFMLGASFLGMVGVIIVLIIFLIRLCSLESFGKPYLMPFVPTYFSGFKDSIIKIPLKKINKRESYLSNNIIKSRSDDNEKD